METFYVRDDQANQIAEWPLSIIGVAVGDALVTFLMDYLLEWCGQCWVDVLRKEAMERILDRPRSWFDQQGNNASHLCPILDRGAEEARGIIGTFVGHILVLCTTVSLAVSWSLATSWKLTMVALACVPLIYAVTTTFQRISERWESRCSHMANNSSSIFSETFTDIRTVKTFALEPYFRAKLDEKLSDGWKLGLKRGIFAGICYGLSQSMIFFLSGKLCPFIRFPGNYS
jgi:ATP-binding cassette, subfamily B (MDR/TAP), member 1